MASKFAELDDGTILKWVSAVDGEFLKRSGTDIVSAAAATLAFSTIAVSGQDDVVADSTGDTLTLVAGSNITITTSAAGDSVTITAAAGVTDHGALTGLGDDDHTIYALLAGRGGSQTLSGGINASESLVLNSTSHATKGSVLIQSGGGHVTVGGGAAASELQVKEASGSGSNYTGFKAQAMAANLVYTLPAADGSSGQVLSTNGSLTLSWAAGATAATQAQQETGTETTVFVTPGRQKFHLSACKAFAWITTSGGTPTLAESYNVSSVDDLGTGQFQVNFDTDFSSAEYAVAPGANRTDADQSTMVAYYGQLAASCNINVRNNSGTNADPTSCSMICFGDQA